MAEKRPGDEASDMKDATHLILIHPCFNQARSQVGSPPLSPGAAAPPPVRTPSQPLFLLPESSPPPRLLPALSAAVHPQRGATDG